MINTGSNLISRDLLERNTNHCAGCHARSVPHLLVDLNLFNYIQTVRLPTTFGTRSPRGGGGAIPPGAGGGRGGAGATAAMAGGFIAGEGLANMMTSAIMRGFQMGTNIMMMPFRYGANAIGERIRDEMSDIKSAGGMFSVDRRNNLGIFKTFDDAIRYQESLNAKLAQSAAALPGETSEYVATAKQITDTVMLSYA